LALKAKAPDPVLLLIARALVLEMALDALRFTIFDFV